MDITVMVIILAVGFLGSCCLFGMIWFICLPSVGLRVEKRSTLEIRSRLRSPMK
eukprot:TRINITY_DN2273_c0_g1_i1.p3 TRINITY_DN2273_c0_g1~~TRINITY_DN2273_c0_g1_i1.p3  ORF type:complete len:54 (-),score=0.16 TRINITY_DN2273_c0_g1_i1:18-179(-)